jgi:hypothetical protein
VGTFALIGAVNGAINSESVWAIAGYVIMGAFGAFLWFLGIKEMRYQNGKASAPRRRRFGCQYCGCLGFHREDCPRKGIKSGAIKMASVVKDSPQP